MIPAYSFKGKRVALFGLGGSGMATAHSLQAGGADLIAFDDNPERVSNAQEAGIRTGDFREQGLAHHAALVLSPGVPLTHPRPHWSAELARSAGVPVIGDIEIFARERREHAQAAPFIAITGTNGKSTTTALIAHVLKSAGRDVQMGGNIGTAILSLEPPEAHRHYVIECSSYQIDLSLTLDPTIGILLNLTPDHLDRHGDMVHYAAIKERLVANSQTAIIGVDDDYSASIASFLQAKSRHVLRISVSSKLDEGIWLDGRKLVYSRSGVISTVADLSQASALRGAHNGQNAAAAFAACSSAGLSEKEIMAGFASFPGLAHRMEQVGHAGKVLFVNDSKATNADATEKALASFDRIYWIAGGLAKDGGIQPLARFFPKIAKAYLVGEAAPSFAATIGDKAPFVISQTIEAAVRHAAQDAATDSAAEPVVLLSPACASFDQFQNFEKRGDAFRSAVLALGNISAMGAAK